MHNLGDFATGQTIVATVNTQGADGGPVTLAGTPSAAVLKDGATLIALGVTLSVDVDPGSGAITGLHSIEVDTSADAAYAAGHDFDIILTAGTVSGVDVTGLVIARFSLANRAVAPQTGDSYGRLGAPAGASLAADVAAVKADTAQIGAAGAGLTALGDTRLANLDAAVSTRLAAAGYTAPDNADIAAIKAKTDNLPSDPADESLIIAATDALAAAIAALNNLSQADIRTAVGIASANLDAQLAALANLDAAVSTRATPAQVNTEVVDALSVDTYAEPGQATPSTTASLAAKIGLLHKRLVNKSERDAAEQRLYNAAGDTVDQKQTLADDGTTFSQGAMQTGP